MKRFAGMFLVVLLLCGGLVLAQNALLMNGAGATFPYPIYSKWFDEFHKTNGNISINYASIGSGAGIRQVTEGTVDFGASDGPMNDDQLKAYQTKHGYPVLHFPTVLGADVPTYNIPGVSAELNFTPDALAGIFLGHISKWNDPAIANANKGVNLPANDIVVVHVFGEDTVVGRIEVARTSATRTTGALSVVGAGINASFENVRRGSAALTAAGIDGSAVATSSFRITWMIDRARVQDAVRLLHREFLEGQPPPVP